MRPRPSEPARPQFPLGLSFPLPLTPSIPKPHGERSVEARGPAPEGGRICPSVCLSGWVGGRLSPDGSLTAPGRSYSTHRGQGLGPQGRGSLLASLSHWLGTPRHSHR